MEVTTLEVVEARLVPLPQNGSETKTRSPRHSWTRQPFDQASLLIQIDTSIGTDCFSDIIDGTISDYALSQQELRRANEVWNESYADVPDGCTHSTTVKPGVKVNFSPELACVQTFEDDEESKSSRRGCWKIDADRFKHRISEVGQALAPILHPDHRSKVFKSRQKSSETVKTEVKGEDNVD